MSTHPRVHLLRELVYAKDDEVPDICPECGQGKCGNCDGTTWDNVHDEPAPCPCYMAGHRP
jgi:hypothetical protein